MDRIEILGTQIDNVSWTEALERIREMIRQGGPHQVITPAIQQVIQARRDPEFRIFGRGRVSDQRGMAGRQGLAKIIFCDVSFVAIFGES